jgi:hypothetical protein
VSPVDSACASRQTRRRRVSRPRLRVDPRQPQRDHGPRGGSRAPRRLTPRQVGFHPLWSARRATQMPASWMKRWRAVDFSAAKSFLGEESCPRGHKSSPRNQNTGEKTPKDRATGRQRGSDPGRGREPARPQDMRDHGDHRPERPTADGRTGPHRASGTVGDAVVHRLLLHPLRFRSDPSAGRGHALILIAGRGGQARLAPLLNAQNRPLTADSGPPRDDRVAGVPRGPFGVLRSVHCHRDQRARGNACDQL